MGMLRKLWKRFREAGDKTVRLGNAFQTFSVKVTIKYQRQKPL